MIWARDFPEDFKAAKAFAKYFENCPDPVLEKTSVLPSLEERIAWTLFGTAIFQDLSYPLFSKLFENVLKNFPEKTLWELPVPKGGELSGIVKTSLDGRNWSLEKHFPGIFWSVGLFVRRHLPLESWMKSRTPKELWRDLGEIYFMGKQAVRPKVCAAVYRLVSPCPFGLGISCGCSKINLPLPLTLGTRRYMAFLGPAKGRNFSEMTQAEKQDMASEFFKALNPKNPMAAAHGFQFFLENGNSGFICKEFTKKCKSCPLNEFCSESEI